MLWDSERDHWVYSNPSGSSYSGGMIMSGPRSSALGSEQGTLNNYVMKGQGGDHITSSQIIDDGTTVRIPGNLQVTGSTILSSALTGSSATFSSNVGIGTTSPTSLLEVQLNQNAQTGIRVRNSTSGTSAGVEFGAYTNSGNGGFGKYSTGNTPYKNISAASTYIYNGSSGDIALLNDVAAGNISFAAGSSSTAQMFISASGFVGMGTTSPSTTLHVNGSASQMVRITTSGAFSSGFYDAFQMLAANQTGGGLSLNVGKAESQNDLAKMVYFHVSNGSTSNRLGFGFYNNDALFNILASGNVGIGTTDTQTFRLAVDGPNVGQGDTTTTIRLFDTTSATTGTGGGISFAGYFSGTSSIINTLSYIKGGKENSTAGDYASYLSFGTRANGASPTERMRIKSNGDVNIRTALRISDESTWGLSIYKFSSTGSPIIEADGGQALSFGTGGERMRIVSSGNVYINTGTNPVTDNAAPQLGILAGAGTDAINIKHTVNGNNTVNIWQTGAAEYSAIAFYKGDVQTNRGLIRVNTSGTTYTSVSDYRLKENIVPLENGLDRVLQLKPSKFNWIETGDETEGFIAHELQEYFPDAVTGEKDATYSSTGNIKPQSVDYGRITPLLVKAIQELKAENDTLKEILQRNNII
jgi:hypothetical protein